MAPPTHTSGMEFEVFLSFRGPDTRRHFTSCLYREMVEKGIRVFKDDEELRVGQKIDGKLLEALDASQIYIPIFSKGFASSPWCLREVAHMVDCTSKSDGNKQILPVFFDVEPDDVKLKTELYRDALSKHEEKYGPDEVKPWEDALVEVPTRVGWKLEGKEFGELIGSIVREVQLTLKVKDQSLPNHLVKVDDQEAIEELLDVDSNGVRFVIIHGIGGVGKSTLAKVIFNQFLSKFSYSSFLEDVQDLSQRHGLLYVQKKLLSDTLGLTSADIIHDTNEGINRIRKGLSNKKVMVVVDNVNKKKQLENLAGDYKWFGSGSRIIITVRDKRTVPYMTTVDEENPMRPSYYLDYPVKEMPSDQAILLFSKHAFRSDMPPEDWCNFSKEVVSSIGRLPLTLEVVGCLFASIDRSKWHKTLKDLKQVPREEIRKTLMTSFNKLDRQKKEIFLDISCFCIGENITNASYMWEDCGYSPHSAIEDLRLMSLIKIDERNTFRMHDELRDLGRYIVKENNFEDAGNRRWVWIDKNTSDILWSNKKKPAVRALSLGIKYYRLGPEELSLFPMLRFLGGENMTFEGNFKKILPNLKWLSWRNHFFDWSRPHLSGPPYPVNLVVLDLSLSNVIDGWHGWSKITMALKVLDLTRCMQLTKTPNFSKFSKLEKLILAFCENLSTIDGSIGKLELLSTLNIEGCKSLQGLPKEIGSLKCLSEIIMPTGDKPFKLPETLGNLESLTKFEIRFHSGISVLPHSIGRLTNVTHLSLRECKNLHELPNSIGKLEALVELDLQSSDICFLPDSIGNLKRLKVLRVRHTRIRRIPGTIGGMEMLQVLDASFCTHLMDEIPWEEWSLTRLRTLELDGTPVATVPTKISGFSSLQTLRIATHRLCLLPELPSSLKCLVVEAAQFPVLPDLSSLVHLHHLEVRKEQCMTFWIPNEVTSPWKDAQSINRLPLSLSTLKLHSIPQLPDFSDFQSLSVLSISGCPTPCLPDISCLKSLQELQLSEFPALVEIPGLGELESLIFLHIKMCDSIEQLPNLWKLKNLRHLELKHCAKLRAVEGLKELNSLKNAEIKQCMSLERLPDVPSFTKLDTNWSPPKVAESTIQSTMPRKRLRLSILEDN